MIEIGTTLVTPPIAEPVTVDLLALQLRLNDTSEYELLTNYITAARQLFEEFTGRALCGQSWKATYHLHSHHPYLGFPYPFQFPQLTPNHIHLPIPKPPLRQVTTLTVNGTEITDYEVKADVEPAIISFMPTGIKPPWDVEIDFDCGYTGENMSAAV